MKRLHVSVAVDDLDASIRFYAALFAAEPTVRKPDYAKWMLDDPRVNFAISDRGHQTGLDHLGIQVETEAELAEVHGRLTQAALPRFGEGPAACCYAQSEKVWSRDPQGVPWETFLTRADSPVYGEDLDLTAETACCTPAEEPARPAGTCC